MLPHEIPDAWADALDKTARELLRAADLTGPPVDALVIAEKLQIAVAWDRGQAGRARRAKLATENAAAGGSRSAILLRPDPRQERLQWAVAHELGEDTAHRVFTLLGIDPCEVLADTRERVANELAGRLLLPSEWFTSDVRDCGRDLVVLKQRYATASHELITRRMLEVAETPLIVTVFDHAKLTWRRSNQSGRVPPLTYFERRCQLAAHERSESITGQDETMRVRIWAIHEPEWKREILLTEPCIEE